MSKITEETVERIVKEREAKNYIKYLESNPQDRYELLERVDSFCSVYKGKDKLTGKDVAMKRFYKYFDEYPTQEEEYECEQEEELERNWKLENKVIREINNVSLLTDFPEHPNVLRLHEIIYELRSDKHYYDDTFMIFDYTPYGDLEKYLETVQTLDNDDIKSFIKDILSGLQYCHEKGIIHCSIQPRNLLLFPGSITEHVGQKSISSEQKSISVEQKSISSEQKLISVEQKSISSEQKGNACFLSAGLSLEKSRTCSIALKICDFGYAIKVSQRMLADQDVYDYDEEDTKYWAPECFKDNLITTAFDIWSAGCLFKKLLEYQNSGKYITKYQENAKDLLEKMLQKDPKERITAESALKHPFFKRRYS